MLNEKEYDLNMKLTKVFKDSQIIKWVDLYMYGEEYICRGAVLDIPNFSADEKCTKLMFIESSQEDCSLSLVILTGKKAGIIWVHLPIEAYYDGTRVLSTKWILTNFNKWISPNTDLKKVKLLYNFI